MSDRYGSRAEDLKAHTMRGILWLTPGVNRRQSTHVFLTLFREYDTVCRVLRDIDIPVPTPNGDITMHFKAGDAVAATTIDNEHLMVDLLKARGVPEETMILGPGGRGNDKAPPTIG